MIDEQSYGTPFNELKSLLLITLTIILALLTDGIGILIHVLDILFQDFNMPEIEIGL